MKTSGKVGTGITLCAFFLSVLSSPAFADKIYLKTGKAYEGKLVGRSERRYLFSVNADGVIFQMSFFPDEVEKIELDKESRDKEVPYLKEVETLKVKVQEDKKDKPKVYEMSLFKESMGQIEMPTLSEAELKKTLTKDEAEYYERFNDILKKYMDKFAAIQNVYSNLTTATKEDFASAKQYMDELYFEMNNIFVPDTFRLSHTSYLESVKANFLAFSALEQGMLDEAAKQMKISEDSKQKSMAEFRQVIVARAPAAAPDTPEKAKTPPPGNETQNNK